MMFKKGDRVLCVDAKESAYLVTGQWYIVNSVFNERWITVEGMKYTWNCDRFVLSSDAININELSREQKIQLIKDLALSL